MQNQTTITCDNCATEINIEEALYTQLQKKFDIVLSYIKHLT